MSAKGRRNIKRYAKKLKKRQERMKAKIKPDTPPTYKRYIGIQC